jgi:hypothetical protein
MTTRFLTAALCCVMAGCGLSTPPQPVKAESGSPQLSPVPHSREADDVARFLAGVKGTEGSPFGELETSDAWKHHRDVLDGAWKGTDERLIQGLRAFQRQELDRAPLREANVFYPFAGPDVLTPLTLFPQSPSYVLVALEPAGTLPTLAQIRKKNLTEYLGAMRQTMSSLLDRSFFVTREMDRQFRGQVTDGLLVPILHLLVRTHHTVLGFRYVRLDDTGKLIDRDANYNTPGVIGNKATEIEFRSDDDQSLHRLIYLSVNLSNTRLKIDPQFVAYTRTLKGSVSLFKATSYMVHKDEFSMIRDLVLEISHAVLQDDSGIPYRFFTPEGWKVQLYGDYNRPYGSFKWLMQPDLRAAFHEPGVKPLPVRIGYGFGAIPSNLLLAERR